MRRPGKSDVLDARAAAQLLRDEQLPIVQLETVEVASIQLWSRLRDDLVTDMTRVRNRLHALLLLCDPEYKRAIPSLLSQRGVRAATQYVAPGSTALDRTREHIVRRVAEQLALLAEQERELQQQLVRAVRDWFAPLLYIEGVGPLIAAGLIAELGLPRHGLGEAQLAALAGVAPLEASSAGGLRHRLNRQGNRRLNRLFHAIALIQERSYAPAQTYMARRQHEGRSSREARRALKRHLVRRVWRQWQACSRPGPSTTLQTT
jgi:transposase